MTTLSSAGWIVHDVGLAASIGGVMFGQLALEPSLEEVSSPKERDDLSEKAWNRFSWVNLASHAAFAVPWIVGRTMLSGREVSGHARTLTLAKDVLVGVSLATGVASFVIGKILGKRTRRGEGPDQSRAGRALEPRVSPALERAVSIVGTGNMLATIGVMALTSLLAMEASQSVKFSPRSRLLP